VQIRKLEERLGHALFERRGRQLHLTEAGQIALDHADAIFATGDELLGTLRQTGAARQALRVGSLATLSRNFQMEFLGPVLGRTDIDLILRSGGAAELLRALEALNLDVVLLNQAPPGDALTPLVTHRLAERPVSLVGTPDRMLPRRAWRTDCGSIRSSCRPSTAACARASTRWRTGSACGRRSSRRSRTWR
jgi:LysR family transcriptional activator of nhaA